MNLKNLYSDDNAVSPVIGVILMVAITVILAAVIGTFVLGLGQNIQTSAPTASITFDQSGAGNTADVTISHDGGDPLAKSSIDITNGENNDVTNWAEVSNPDEEITGGESITIDDVGTGTTIKVVWTAEGGKTSSVLAEYTVE